MAGLRGPSLPFAAPGRRSQQGARLPDHRRVRVGITWPTRHARAVERQTANLIPNGCATWHQAAISRESPVAVAARGGTTGRMRRRGQDFLHDGGDVGVGGAVVHDAGAKGEGTADAGVGQVDAPGALRRSRPDRVGIALMADCRYDLRGGSQPL